VPASTPEVSFERVPYVLARYLDTWDFSFFDHTGHVEKTAGRNFRLLDEQPPDRVIVPVEKPFGGRVFVLTGPQMSSAGYLIARDLKASGAARLIGRPTGGNLRGLNGGQLAWITLPNSGVTIDIPLIAWMPASPQPDSGVQPDVLVDPTLEDVARGIDPEMAAALALLRKP
jgi:C-terminal processing protease CtpA/Prc